ATVGVPVRGGAFCRRGGRFGPHSSNESFTPIYHGRLVFIAYFNAGVRAVDIRDPFHPVEAGFFIPETTVPPDKRCIEVSGAPRCKVAIQTNNVEVDDRGYIYLADRADTGLHIVELTGPARAVANFSRRDIHEPIHRPLRHGGPEHLQPALDQHAARTDAAPARARLLAGVEREPEPAHRRPHRLPAARVPGRDHHRRDAPRSGTRRGP